MFTIATWNVNSIRVRLPHICQWIEQQQPDVLALQETKVTDDQFPGNTFTEMGYQFSFSGQKTFNGVAVLSKYPLKKDIVEFPQFADPQCRVLGCSIGNWFILNLYVPNGQAVGSEKYQYKLAWLSALTHYIDVIKKQFQHIILLGDFNIAPADIDVHDPKAWEGHVLVSPAERLAWQTIIDKGLTDAFRHMTNEQYFSWWDYRQAAFRRNKGLRIDHILASKTSLAHLVECSIDKTPRKWERPSDHAPVLAKFSVEPDMK